MTTKNVIVKKIGWLDAEIDQYQWIRPNDPRYQYLKNELINNIFPLLRTDDNNLLLNGLIKVINLVHIKFGFTKQNENLLWEQLRQNRLLDLRALLGIMLPYISDNETDSKKRKLKKLEDLYLEVNEKGSFVYTNSQYNRCVRHDVNGKIMTINRPFLKEYFLDHLELLLMSIETMSNKLYVNWVDILPVKMNEYMNTKLYQDTVVKIGNSVEKVALINNYIDPKPGLSYQDFYNVMSNHLFHQIKNQKWLIYDIIVHDRPISFITYLETKFNLSSIWDGLLWSQIDKNYLNTFIHQWNNFFNSTNVLDTTILNHFYFFFSKYHKNSQKLIRQKKLIIDFVYSEADEENEENIKITPETTRNAKIGMASVPIEEIYLFFSDQFSEFKKSWYYYTTKIKKLEYLARDDNNNNSGARIYITSKNIYNYCKSLVHYTTSDGTFVEIPKLWYSLKPELIEMVMRRILNVDNLSQNNWFNINNYIRKFYPNISRGDLPAANETIHRLVRTKIVDVVFESLIYHGLLVNFLPNKSITDDATVQSSINSTNDREKTNHKRNQMKKQYFSGKNRTDYENNAYYYITGASYGELPALKSKDYDNGQKKYFDFLSSDQIWTFTYAMNWVSQINFFHHFLNNRVMYITGATGVGKSTQVPKLLLFGQKMLDYNLDGKIICTQPRIPPTVENADTISRELGVPIRAYNGSYDKVVFTSNYYIQYKHQKDEHIDRSADSFLRIVTDGTLLEEMKKSPFLTRSIPEKNVVDINGQKIEWAKTFSTGNKYDIIIVDEAHEHNANMDMILTLARDSVYVNNSIKLVIISATMDDDDPIYRRYYRNINDNRSYPLSAFIEIGQHDRANMDRRIHISPPGATTQYTVTDHYLSKSESDLITDKNFVDYGIKKTIELANSTTTGDILLFMSGQADIVKAVKEINSNTASNIIALGYYSELSEEMKNFIVKIHQLLPTYTRLKEDALLDEKDIIRRVPEATYNRAVIIATNVAEASITLQNLRYVVDTGYAKVVVFDPVESISKMITLPISQSSSTQRRGRVGRVASGDVYYMYDEEKIINNKTAYKIADVNVEDLVVKLLKSDPRDSFIINNENDINNINNLERIIDKKKTLEYDPEFLIYDILKNPRPYTDIIKKQYLYISEIRDIWQYYTYYGKTNGEDYPTINSILDNKNEYFVENHDDYHYQKNIAFASRAYTGYDDFILEDRSLSFYIIHPDENVIGRNLFTGRMEYIKDSSSVTDAYYYCLLKTNNILFKENSDMQYFDFHQINFNNFTLLKFIFAMDDAKLQLLTIDIPMKPSDVIVKYSNARPLAQKYIEIYYSHISAYYQSDFTTIRSAILSNLSEIQSLASLSILNNMNNLLWYSYAIPYGLETDILAIMSLIETVPNIAQWIGSVKSKQDIEKFFRLHMNKKGDIYFLWKLWNGIKDILNRYDLLAITKIDISLESKFKNYKEQYLKYIGSSTTTNIKSSLPFEEFLTLDTMFKSGKLNVIDEFYNYIGQIKIDFKDIIRQNNINTYIDIIAKDNRLNPEKLQDFLVEYFDILFQLNRKVWLYQYEIKNKLQDEGSEVDIIEWAKNKLSLPGIITDPNYYPTEWDHILETYIRAFSSNLIKNEGYHYLQINKGIRLDPAYWSKRLLLEKTFLNDKMDYIIYHNNESTSDNVNIAFLTPVKLEWVLELNPIYYYYFFFDKNNSLYLMKDDDDVIRSINIINSNKNLFNYSSLIAYLDQIDSPVIQKIIREELTKQAN